MEAHRLALIIPAFNEATTIEAVVVGSARFGQPIVVNDCSSDSTAQLAHAAGAVVVNHSTNLGYDEALNSGFAKAHELGFNYVITLDADGQHDPALIRRFIDVFDDGVGLVLGIRSDQARIAEKLFSMYTYLRFGVSDPLCGLKGYKMDLYRKVGHFDSYRSIGTELMLRSLRSGTKFVQIRFNVKSRLDEPRFGRSISANLKILRALWLWLRTSNLN